MVEGIRKTTDSGMNEIDGHSMPGVLSYLWETLMLVENIKRDVSCGGCSGMLHIPEHQLALVHGAAFLLLPLAKNS